MTLELILWLVAWVVISEVGFIVWSIIDSKREKGMFETEIHWLGKKFLAFFAGGFFIAIQGIIVFGPEGTSVDGSFTPSGHYINLLYEAIILVVLGGFFLGNWFISKKIEKSAEEKKEKEKKKGKK